MEEVEEKDESPRRARRRANLRLLVDEAGGAAQLSREAGTPKSHVSALLAGKRGLGDDLAGKLEELYSKPSGWFDSVPQVPAVLKTDYLPGFEELSIPVLAQTGSMGGGAEANLSDVVRGRLTVSPQWALQYVKPTDLKNLRFIHGYGDSMDPTFIDGDILLVDIGVKDPKIDGVYVMEANDRIYIKRVRQRMDGSFEVSSDNPNVKTVDVLNGGHSVEIHGRVVWCWNGKKM